MIASYNEQIIGLLQILLKQIKVPFTKSSLKYDLEIHHDFPSLFSIIRVLKSRKIEAVGLNMKPNLILNVEEPCILIPTNGNYEPCLYQGYANGSIKLTYSNGRNEWVKDSIFLANWQGITLLVEPSPDSLEINYEENVKREVRNKYEKTAFVTLVFILITGALLYPSRINDKILIINCLCGLALCIMLSYSHIQSNSFIKRLCTVGKNSDCNSILNSPAAMLFGWLRVADFGLVYFLTLTLSFLYVLEDTKTSSNYLSLFFIITLLSLPYTFFSVYYQYRVAKQWCPLCLGVQAVIWFNFLLLFSSLNDTFVIEVPKLYTIFILLISTFFCTILWILIRLLLIKVSKLKPALIQLNKLRNDPVIFQSILRNSDELSFEKINDDICIGTLTAPISITVVTDPNCIPCKNTHQYLEKLQEEFSSHIRLSAILCTKEKNAIHSDNNAAVFILNLPASERHLCLKHWFESGSVDFGKTFNEEDKLFGIKLLEVHNNWCFNNDIQYTPTVYINGRRIPDFYTLQNLRHHIEVMFEELALD